MDLFEQRIKELREIINRHNHNYYVLNAPTVSDQEFDALLRELQDLEAKLIPEMLTRWRESLYPR